MKSKLKECIDKNWDECLYETLKIEYNIWTEKKSIDIENCPNLCCPHNLGQFD